MRQRGDSLAIPKSAIRRNIAQGGFVLVKPKELSDAERIARAIARCKGIRKVFVSSGEYGFIAAAEDGDALAETSDRIRKITMGRVKTARTHLTYQVSGRRG